MTRKTPPKISFLLARNCEMAASEFKARCLEVMDEVQRSGVEVTITKHRKPIARLVPVREAGGIVGSMRGQVLWQGDIVSPTGERGTADEENVLGRPRRRAR